jgi:hypothetical protein
LYRPDGNVRLAAPAGPWQPARHDDVFEPVSWLPLPPKVIQHAVWLYHGFSLSLRDVELILAARGIISSESIRELGLRFGRIFANMLKRRTRCVGPYLGSDGSEA